MLVCFFSPVVVVFLLPPLPAPDSSGGSKHTMCCPSWGPAPPSCSPLSRLPEEPSWREEGISQPRATRTSPGPLIRALLPAAPARPGAAGPWGRGAAAPACWTGGPRAAEDEAEVGNVRLCCSRRETPARGWGMKKRRAHVKLGGLSHGFWAQAGPGTEE